ncbi:hypothetical protein LMH87_004366 [Akanthomyces muscarius]|uniref:Aminoglycoside phosphotransferase domain-containing protein n=1 Tax=Akanthomyces muscarius TaxID=2231603 RepID=A0A9W8Q3Y5_AKAMU|nr:hypothetical protein LMH87_004366 [Akanthomyces muscarius]KAJ4145518.1 hypothetical protein LMH87_004366 [Akanthomyces muscarius]
MSVPPSPGHPHDDNRVEQRNEDFCSSVDVDLVKKLAARHNGDKLCRISAAAESGYTFTCYKVTFPDDGKEWVVRIAIPSPLEDEWDMVRTEVATTRHLQRLTKIPVPAVHAYGTNERLTTDQLKTQSWIISDRLPGKPIKGDHLKLMTREKRLRLFSQLGDVLAQLQELTFPNTGSLYPDDSDDMKAKIGPSLCRQDRVLGGLDGVARTRPTFITAWDSIEHHLRMTRGMPDMRLIRRVNDIKDVISRQVVALDAVNRHVRDENHSFWREDAGFTLSHPCMIGERIFVDDDGNIQGIVQWACSEILPRQLCHPPDLVMGTYSTASDRKHNPVWAEFLEAITPDHSYHKHLRYYLDNKKHMGFASMLRSPSYVDFLYFWDKLYYTQHKQPPPEMLAEFFSKPENQAELDRRLADQKQHSDDVIVRQGAAMEPKLVEIRDWFIKVHELVILASKSGNYISEPFSSTPVFYAWSE